MAKTPSASEILQDATMAHSWTLLRVAAGQREAALAVLESLETELAGQADLFGKIRNPAGERYKELEAETGRIIRGAYKVIAGEQKSALEQIATSEVQFINTAMNKAVGVSVFSQKISPQVLQAVSGPIIFGAPAGDWWNGQAAALRAKFGQEMAKGILMGEDNAALVRRVRGTKANGYKDGIMNVSKREATALVRTSVISASNYARIETFRTMGTVKGIQWVATLDSRTTEICMALDKKQWRFPDLEPIGHNKRFPGPTAHWQCRSTQTAVTYSWSELAGKKIPETDNKTLQAAVEDKLREEGKTEEQVTAYVARARASIDGPVSASSTFEDWARTKPPEFVEKLVGPGRYALFDAGQISFSDLTNQDNRPLTLAALKDAVETGNLPSETLRRVPFNPPAASITAPPVLRAVQAAATEARKEATEAAAVEIAKAESRAQAAEKALQEEQESQVQALMEQAAQLADMGEKFASGETWSQEETRLFRRLPAATQRALLKQWEELKKGRR